MVFVTDRPATRFLNAELGLRWGESCLQCWQKAWFRISNLNVTTTCRTNSEKLCLWWIYSRSRNARNSCQFIWKFGFCRIGSYLKQYISFGRAISWICFDRKSSEYEVWGISKVGFAKLLSQKIHNQFSIECLPSSGRGQTFSNYVSQIK